MDFLQPIAGGFVFDFQLTFPLMQDFSLDMGMMASSSRYKCISDPK